MDCEVCGAKNADRRARIEGVILRVCRNCVSLGEELPTVIIEKQKKAPQKIVEVDKRLVPKFNLILKQVREKRNLTQEEFAGKLSEKVSVIKRIEEGWEPPSGIIKKLERFFNIKLTEEVKEEKIQSKKEKKKLTIGDVVEIR